MNKQLNAKLQYALDGLSLAKEQKQALMDVFAEIGNNSGGGGGQSGTVYVSMVTEYEKPTILKIGDYEIPFDLSNLEIEKETGYGKMKIYNRNLYNYLKNCYDNEFKFFFTIFNEYLDMNLIRTSSNTYPIGAGYTGSITDHFSIVLLSTIFGIKIEIMIHDYDQST